MSTFLTGVNYWPRRSAMYMWQRFDLGEIREDLARMKALGLEVVRFFLLWEDFQPAPDRMNPDALRRFDQMMQAIADAGLFAMPTLYCGHMSGVNWLPAWSLEPETPHGRFRTIANGRTSPYGIGDFYSDVGLLRAQEFFANAVGERARNHPALFCWDLGNEFSNLREPLHPQDAERWSAQLSDVLQQASGVGATGGLHGEDVERDRVIRPSTIARPWMFATMHGYSVYSTFSRGPLDTDVVPFYLRVIQSFTEKPTLFSEFGNPACPVGTTSPFGGHACLTEDEMADYATAVIEKLYRAGSLGALWWCWADYVSELADLPPFDRAPHELYFGLVRADGNYKPVARVLERVAKQRRPVLPARRGYVPPDAGPLRDLAAHGPASYLATVIVPAEP